MPVLLGLLAACSSAPQRLGSDLPAGVQLTAGRVIKAQACDFLFFTNDRFQRAYAELATAAGRELITDVEVHESSACVYLRARAAQVLSAAAVAAPAPAAWRKGASARLDSGGRLRTQPRSGAAGVVPEPGSGTLTLGSRLTNQDGTWWYATVGGQAGWVLESDLEAAAP